MDTITAAQLIAELQTIPADTPVYLYIDGHRAGIHPFVDPLADGTADLNARYATPALLQAAPDLRESLLDMVHLVTSGRLTATDNCNRELLRAHRALDKADA